MLIKNPKKRIGYLDLSEIKNHIWIKDYPWDKLLNKEITPPFVPVNSDYNFDINHVNKKENINKQTKKLYKRWLKNNSSYDNPFKYFNYNETNLLFTKNESKLNKTPLSAIVFTAEGNLFRVLTLILTVNKYSNIEKTSGM